MLRPPVKQTAGIHRVGGASLCAAPLPQSRDSGKPRGMTDRTAPRWPLPPGMQAALGAAREAAAAGEVPVGAAVVQGGTVIAAAHNAPRSSRDPTAHAEILAIRQAAARLGAERLADCDLYVTLEPCPMCAGAIVHARIARLYYAASDPKGGAVEHGCRAFAQPNCLHRPEIYSGLGDAEAAGLLRDFFRERRT